MDMFLSSIINKQRKIKETRKERISLLSRMDDNSRNIGLEVKIKLRPTFVTKRLLTEQKWKYPEKAFLSQYWTHFTLQKKQKQKQKQFIIVHHSSLYIVEGLWTLLQVQRFTSKTLTLIWIKNTLNKETR